MRYSINLLKTLQEATRSFTEPTSLLLVRDYGRDPFLILIACLLSLRAKDTVTYPVSKLLFARARTPQQLLAIPLAELEGIIRPIGFFRRKAQVLHDVCTDLIERFESKVPATQEELMSIKGIGPKTANLVLSEGFGVPAICVDVHVHRIANRLGLVSTKAPEETELALKALFPRDRWSEINTYLVMWGQNVCTPTSPFCSSCAVRPLCKRVGVVKSR
jgi:Predicted EndoIII-related endonuclease